MPPSHRRPIAPASKLSRVLQVTRCRSRLAAVERAVHGRMSFSSRITVTADDRHALDNSAKATIRSLFVTRRKDGGLQSSPMSCAADEEGTLLTATPAASAKVGNLVRDPRATVCLFTNQWPGPWMHVEGEAEIS